MRPLLALLVVAINAASCLDPTQVDLEITTNMPCGAGAEYPRLVGTEIQTGTSLADLKKVASTTECHGDKRVGNLVLVPGSGTQVYVQVIGRVATSPTAQIDLPASRIIRYVTHEKLELPIDLSSECIGKVCDPQQTCSKGMCIDRETTGCRAGECDSGGSPDAMVADAGSDTNVGDALLDGPLLDAKVDAPLDAPAPPDAGPCGQLPLLANYDFYWPFNEPNGAMKVTESVTSTPSTFVNGPKTGPGLCGDALLLPNFSAQALNACTTGSCFKGGQLKIAFFLKLGSGTGIVVAHLTGMSGAWSIEVLSGPVLRFGVNFGGVSYTPGVAIPTNQYALVQAAASPNGIAIAVNGVNGTLSAPFQSLPVEGPYILAVGAQSMDYAIDELFISSK